MQSKPYSRLQKWLHLLVVVFLVVDVAFQGGMTTAFRRGVQTGEFMLSPSASMHFLIGIAVLLAVLARLTLVREQGGMQTRAALPFMAIYVLLILVALSGVLAWGLGSATVAKLHHLISLALYGVVVVHVIGRFVVEFVLKNNTLSRMFSDFW
ncbi:hypothetical protein ACMU_10330 [Actibacterium mucosum KCTC 23349]|uniref:Cytochrome b561 bacterial/Ni-hydrogenase domain-containing protein n=1 Tax=Actibacterium mucosum KCTC 23349 TaxID=1454373 RepID=A0A037ZJ53_9RHOB|nr:cytochrome b/b6 domain-containing protein [Actibacterium mucosum]KAJ56143.1 hypothetical protein ACMU_10330 [Actibacterium mucosum KCTC 23349]